MKDFNFFSPYIEVKKALTHKFIYIVSIAGILVALIGGFFSWSYMKMNRLEKEIASMESFLTSKDTLDEIMTIRDIESKTSIMDQYKTIIEGIYLSINRVDSITTELLKEITSAMPKGITFEVMALDSKYLQIQGTSYSRRSIAELIHNFKTLQGLEGVHVMTIDEELQEDGLYTFTLNCSLKDVDAYETD